MYDGCEWRIKGRKWERAVSKYFIVQRMHGQVFKFMRKKCILDREKKN